MRRILHCLCQALRSSLEKPSRPAIPAGGDLLWRWFHDLNQTRTWHSVGPNPISYSEIEAYARLHALPLRSDHIAVIRAMDRTFMEHVYRGRNTSQTPDSVKVLPPRSSSPMTSELFDALFG